MVSNNDSKCPDCGGRLRYYDSVRRIVRTKSGCKRWIKIRRLRCDECNELHRELPDFIFPYKHYDGEIIQGVLEGFITAETYGFEDYPSEMTMVRWLRENNLLLYERSDTMNHKIIFNQNTSINAEDNDEYNYMFVHVARIYLNDLLIARGYIYLNQIYEYFGVKWNVKDENPYRTSKDGKINFDIRKIDDEFVISFEL